MGIELLCKRGEIYLVDLNPTVGAEIKKTRPAVIISNNLNNQHADTVTVIPITSSIGRIYPFEALLPAKACGLAKDSRAKCNQIRTIDKKRLVRCLGAAPKQTLVQIEKALLVHCGIYQNR
jgi:mRNA interferase MazF